ncbi:hypothetical protein TSOC_001490 [Tetrabaena socialis]|uniref:Uncharacterized protein n=1 Tax=Tetrabaena socialis TaxID=47790 RepID=A0A2J8AGI8_9CHLO|nr:hypothetical protein TSOC_001490 [Tetrabaena socialis]|eukprot:PNH11627.1 hypothetical protein TSOC_001490 [Tetrabaena socialis]
MFGLGFGRGKNEEVKKLKARGVQLEQQLDQASDCRRELSSGRTLKPRFEQHIVHRLALQRAELQNDRDRVLREHRELQLANLRLEEEARAVRSAGADMWQVTNLQAALRQQAAQHETKMASLKRRTKALLTAVLPGSQANATRDAASAGGAAAALSSPGAAPAARREAVSAPVSPSLSEAALPDLWDVPLSPVRLTDAAPRFALGADAEAGAQSGAPADAKPDVNTRIRQIVGWLYDDTLSEDQALEHITSLAQGLALTTAPGPHPHNPPSASAVQSRGCSPLPPPPRCADATDASDKVDAATGTQTARVRHVVDAATETPAHMSYLGSPNAAAATPSEPSGSPRRAGYVPVPPLNLAALVAEAMQAAPMSSRSNASTTAGGGAGGGAGSSAGFNAFSHFVLAQPEKLQRLIMRHAAATAAKAGLPPPTYSAHAGQGGHTPAVGGGSMDHQGLGLAAYGCATATDSVLMPTDRGGSMTSRLTSRLLGLGTGSSAANVSRANTAAASAAHPAPSGSSSAAAGVVLPASACVTSPSKGTKRMSSAPKFAMLDSPPSAQGAISGPKAPTAGGRQAGVPDLKPLWGGIGGGSSSEEIGAGGRMAGGGLLDSDDWPTFGGGSTLAVARTGGTAR